MVDANSACLARPLHVMDAVGVDAKHVRWLTEPMGQPIRVREITGLAEVKRVVFGIWHICQVVGKQHGTRFTDNRRTVPVWLPLGVYNPFKTKGIAGEIVRREHVDFTADSRDWLPRVRKGEE